MNKRPEPEPDTESVPLARVRSFLTCPVCDRLLWRPQRLGCGDVVCAECVVNPLRPRSRACPICHKSIRKQSDDTQLQSIVAALWPREREQRPNSKEDLALWVRHTIVNVMRSHAQLIHQVNYFTDLDRTVQTAHHEDKPIDRCLCRKPSLPSGFVVVPRTNANGRVIRSCPAWSPDKAKNNSCRYFKSP